MGLLISLLIFVIEGLESILVKGSVGVWVGEECFLFVYTRNG